MYYVCTGMYCDVCIVGGTGYLFLDGYILSASSIDFLKF